MGPDVNVPPLITQKSQIRNRRFRAGKKNQVGIAGDWLTRLDQHDIDILLAGKRIEIVEIGNPAQHRHRNLHRRTVA